MAEMSKTPDEIKKRLDNPIRVHFHINDIEPRLKPLDLHDLEILHADALAYIQQLEAANTELLTRCKRLERERDALMHWARGRCDTCAHNDDCVKHDPDPEGLIVHWYDDCESWEWRGVKEE